MVRAKLSLKFQFKVWRLFLGPVEPEVLEQMAASDDLHCTVVSRTVGSCGAADTSDDWSQGIKIGSSPPMLACLLNRIPKNGRYRFSPQ